jgi:hypothetical protein
MGREDLPPLGTIVTYPEGHFQAGCRGASTCAGEIKAPGSQGPRAGSRLIEAKRRELWHRSVTPVMPCVCKISNIEIRNPENSKPKELETSRSFADSSFGPCEILLKARHLASENVFPTKPFREGAPGRRMLGPSRTVKSSWKR